MGPEIVFECPSCDSFVHYQPETKTHPGTRWPQNHVPDEVAQHVTGKSVDCGRCGKSFKIISTPNPRTTTVLLMPKD